MRVIDLETWPRRRHFEFFRGFENPHFGLCADVDVTALRRIIRERDLPLTVVLTYVLSRAANEIPEFRQRIRGETIVEHEVVHPSLIVLTDEELFGFCYLPYVEDFAAFAAGATEAMRRARAHPRLEDEPGRDDLLFMSPVPWVSFTAVLHPVPVRPVDSVPRIAWGKLAPSGERLRMPLAVQVHHGLLDGLHLGRYFSAVQGLLDEPTFLDG